MKYEGKNIKITGTGSYVPEKIVSNTFFEKMGLSDEVIYSRTGVKERRIVENNQTTSDLAVIAAERAIKDAGLKSDDIDLIVLASISPNRLTPSTACFVQEKLQMTRKIPAFDISAACSGFLYSIVIGSQFIESKMCKNVLVIGSEILSMYCNWESTDSIFWGDGAGAVILSHRIYADGVWKDSVSIAAGGSELPASNQTLKDSLHTLRFDGNLVFKQAREILPKIIKEVVKDAKLSIDDISYIIPSQTGRKMLQKIFDISGIPWEKVMTNMEKYANTSAASIPIMLDEIKKIDKLKKGDIILFVTIGAGLTWGASILRW